MFMTETETIICRPTKWFLWRALAMLAMFGVFFGLFLRDWKVGYPRKNVVYYTYLTFEAVEEEFATREEAGQSAAEWQAFADTQKIPYPDEAGLLPSGVDPKSPWPAELRDYAGYKAAFGAERDKAVPPMWVSYSDAQGWDSAAPEHGYDRSKIREQLYFGIGAGVLTLITLFYLLRTKGRVMTVDGEGYTPPGGKIIPFDQMRRIDKRKWETKGLAYLYYEDGGDKLGKTKVDGMVYGQFREEDEAPAEKLFQHILRNFSGELVELEELEDEREEAGETANGQKDRED